MTKTDFIDSNPVLISKLMQIGTISFLDPRTIIFKGMAWVIDRNLSWDELSLINEYGLVVGEVCIADGGGLLVWIAYAENMKELNRPHTG